MSAVDRFDAWWARHEVGIDRAYFWWSVTLANFALFGVIAAINQGEWLVLPIFGALWLFGAAWASEGHDSLRLSKRQHGYPPYPVWVQRVRRWVRIALMGWST